MSLFNWLSCPLTRGLDLDDPQTTALRRQIIHDKLFLNRLYREWYSLLCDAIPERGKPVLELGAGAGFLKDYIPDLITSDVRDVTDVDCVVDGRELPFEEKSLRAIVMTDVLHHIPDVERFFIEAIRCLEPGGVIAMVEPWVSTWSRFVYRSFHHEPFEPDMSTWKFPATGPLSGANMALPWIVFCRDRERFDEKCKQLKIEKLEPFMPLRYLVSGGVSMRSFAPGWTFGIFSRLERLMLPCMNSLAMFAFIVLRREKEADLQ